jgi:hypothetical protein
MKKWVALLLALVVVTTSALYGFRLVSPEIVVINSSNAVIDEVAVRLPSSRVVFGPIAPGQESTIYYSLDQADGAYEFTVNFTSGSRSSGSCGYVTSSQFGRRLEMRIGVDGVICLESDKLSGKKD